MKKTITKSKHKTAPKDNHVQRVFNLIILDESGSMSSIAGQAISGLNEVFQTIGKAQKEHLGQQHFISFVTFNSTKIRTVFDRQAVRSDKEIMWTDYMPNSCTPLYDAMGESLSKLKKHVGDDDVVLVTIITDGYENASREYSGHDIKRLVAELKEKGWSSLISALIRTWMRLLTTWGLVAECVTNIPPKVQPGCLHKSALVGEGSLTGWQLMVKVL